MVLHCSPQQRASCLPTIHCPPPTAGNPCSADPGVTNQKDGMDCSGSLDHGQTCTLLCHEGYTKSGELTCTAGAWDAPTCDGMAEDWPSPTPLVLAPVPHPFHPTGNPCPPNPGVANQKATWGCTGSLTHGSTCVLLCEPGYTKSADLTCTAGAWNTQTCDGVAACMTLPLD